MNDIQDREGTKTREQVESLKQDCRCRDCLLGPGKNFISPLPYTLYIVEGRDLQL